jgi:3-mercaptopropionate dioxygenase
MNALRRLVEQLGEAVVGGGGGGGGGGEEDRAAEVLRAYAPLEVVAPALRTGRPDRLTSHLLYAAGEYSVLAMVCRPGQHTTIHDHIAWGAVAVLFGTETETTYAEHGGRLTPVGHSINRTGSVTAFTPPGDIHRIRNDGEIPTISLHVYGADLRVAGSSVRRTYDLAHLGEDR